MNALPHYADAARRVRAGGRARGLGLIEMMLALAISAAVLTAVATALDVSFKSYAVNQENANLMQRARLAMHRITTDIRTTTLHAAPTGSAAAADLAVGKIATTPELWLYRDMNGDGVYTADEMMKYSYDSVNQLVMCIDFQGNEYVLARGVTAFAVKLEPMRSEQSIRTGGGYDLIMRANITMSVKTSGQSSDIDEKFGDQTVTLSTSVIPRRNVF